MVPDDDSMLAQGTVDFRNEERRHAHGYEVERKPTVRTGTRPDRIRQISSEAPGKRTGTGEEVPSR